MVVSQNGYTANDITKTSVRTVPGTERKIRLRNGPAGDLLLWVLAQFHRRVEPIDTGQLDDWGYAERPIRGSTTVLSNHASGTAADANATRHPQGTSPSANFTPAQIDTIHAILAETQGCVRWGGDYVSPALKDGMHFEIVRDEATCARALAALTTGEEDDMPSAEEVAKAVWNEATLNAVNKQWTAARDILRFGHMEAELGRDEMNAKLDTLIARASGAPADEVAAKLLPALSSTLAAAVAKIDVSQLDKLSDEDIARVVSETVKHAGDVLSGRTS